MTDPLAKIQAIHDESVRLGLGRVLPKPYVAIDYNDGKGPLPFGPGGRTPKALARAGFSWWLREWCRTHDALMLHTPKALDEPQADTAYYIAWAGEILAAKETRT